ncbi:K(+)-transporting ATPase subunit F [Tatumella sp. TA1]|nr:K(+)-transporting ATPase subunit F [Rosenbergiella collisarenosi]QGX92789.1 K(+)-transporting ATPase subunit F [Tatumella sp. TA1]
MSPAFMIGTVLILALLGYLFYTLFHAENF